MKTTRDLLLRVLHLHSLQIYVITFSIRISDKTKKKTLISVGIKILLTEQRGRRSSEKKLKQKNNTRSQKGRSTIDHILGLMISHCVLSPRDLHLDSSSLVNRRRYALSPGSAGCILVSSLLEGKTIPELVSDVDDRPFSVWFFFLGRRVHV